MPCPHCQLVGEGTIVHEKDRVTSIRMDDEVEFNVAQADERVDNDHDETRRAAIASITRSMFVLLHAQVQDRACCLDPEHDVCIASHRCSENIPVASLGAFQLLLYRRRR
jgi:hypothetical protein